MILELTSVDVIGMSCYGSLPLYRLDNQEVWVRNLCEPLNHVFVRLNLRLSVIKSILAPTFEVMRVGNND
jgi:hypothetical protein